MLAMCENMSSLRLFKNIYYKFALTDSYSKFARLCLPIVVAECVHSNHPCISGDNAYKQLNWCDGTLKKIIGVMDHFLL